MRRSKIIDIATLEAKNTGETLKKAVKLPAVTQMLLEKLGMSNVVFG